MRRAMLFALAALATLDQPSLLTAQSGSLPSGSVQLLGDVATGVPQLRQNIKLKLAGTCTQDSITSFNPLKDAQTTSIAPGHRQNFGLQTAGGTGQFRYMLAAGWEQEVGFLRMPLVEQERIRNVQGLSSISEWQLRPNALSKVNLRGNFTADLGSRADLTLSNGLIRQSFRNSRDQVPIIAGFWGRGYNDAVSHGYLPGVQVGDYFQVKIADDVTRYISSLAGNYRATDWLATRATVGLDYSNTVLDLLQQNGQGPPGLGRTGQRTLGNNGITQYSMDVGATATTSVTSSLSSKTSVGAQYNRRAQVYGASTGTGLPPGSQTLVGAATLTTSELHTDAIVVGSYVQQELGWRDRLFGTVAFRADGASTFGQNLHTAIYPKLSVSWLASQEPKLSIPAVSSLRLRAAYGSAGVQPPSTASITTLGAVTASVNGTPVSAVIPAAFGNSRVGPERQNELEGGLDLEAWNGRLRTEITAYSRNSTDALILVPIAISAGGGATYQNVGSVSNRGMEGLVNVRVIDRDDVGLDIMVNASTNANKLVSVNPNAPPGFFQNLGFGALRHRVGYPLYALWQRPILSYADQNGDGIIVPSEIVVGDTEVYVGPSAPTKLFSYGGTLSLWRDVVRIGALFDTRGGYQRLDYSGWIGCALFAGCAGSYVPGSGTFVQQAAIQAYAKSGTEYGFISSGAFTRLRELSATTRLPAMVLNRIGARAGSLTLSARNLWLSTKWLGADPEVNFNPGTDDTWTFPTAPVPRYLIARLNFSY